VAPVPAGISFADAASEPAAEAVAAPAIQDAPEAAPEPVREAAPQKPLEPEFRPAAARADKIVYALVSPKEKKPREKKEKTVRKGPPISREDVDKLVLKERAAEQKKAARAAAPKKERQTAKKKPENELLMRVTETRNYRQDQI
ncbi:MAG: hypothetical protein FWE62_02430, partial [Firmicutes bacterium]|nr:hypothetical protein [Bacillota bacterium]